MKKVISFVFLATIVLSMFTSALAVEFIDMPKDWSTEALRSAVDNGLLKGDSQKILPKENLTRAQMAAIIVRAFGAYTEGDLSSFQDIEKNAWYISELSKAYKMGIILGSGKGMEPNQPITREQAFVILARAIKLQPADTAIKLFSDIGQVSTWAKGEIYAMINAGYISGSGGKLNPKDHMTRAEFAQVMYNIFDQYIKTAGVYETVHSGNVVINASGVTLKDLTVTGDLFIGDGVGDGEVILNNVKVEGRLVVRGGGENSIKIIGNSNIQSVIIARVDGIVRVFSGDGAEIGEVLVDGKDDVILEGEIGSVEVIGESITVTAINTQIDTYSIAGVESVLILGSNSTISSITIDATDATIRTESGSTIDEVTVNRDDTTIEGQGDVKQVNANANNISVSTPKTLVTAGENTSGITAGTKPVEEGKTVEVPQVETAPPVTTISVSAISGITGTAKVGVELTAGTLTPANATVSYQWMICDTEEGTFTNIGGATTSKYTPVIEDIGKYLKVKVTGTGSYTGRECQMDRPCS